MAKITNRFQPNFSLYPLNNNRTGWQPVNIPLILVIPFRRTIDGIPISNSEVTDVTFAIEDAPGRSKVGGHDHIGVFVPNLERYKITIDSTQLANVRIDVDGQIFYDQNTLELKDFENVINGDLMEYTMLRGPSGAFGSYSPGPKDRIPYLRDAEYYDLSPFVIETANLCPSGLYNFVYQARYFPRLISPEGEFICIDDDGEKVLARFAFLLNHPGDLHEAMVKNTPAFYFEASSKELDPTITFYRPFADALQDIFDEQELLKGVNFVDKIPVQFIPYLSYLLGLDMPYFPSTTDEIRRALLRNGRKLQQLKGSRRAIKELFEIFGFTIDIANLWFSKDGTRFIAPGEQLPSNIEDQEITTEDICHAEPLISNWQTPGFGQVEVPLLFKPKGNITVDAWLTTTGTATDIALSQAVNDTASDIEAFNTNNCALTIDGFQLSTTLQNSIPATSVLGHSTILVNQILNGIDEKQVGKGKPLNKQSIVYNVDRNSLVINFDHFLGFERNQTLYIFATYERTKIILPPALADLRSNRFDINILLFKNGEVPTSDVFEFLIEFLFRFKAFHSLLRKITFKIECDEIYNVIDFCAGGRQAQSSNSDAGNLQRPPPIFPEFFPDPGDSGFECDPDAINRKYSGKDVAFRSRILELLRIEHETWKRLDNTHEVPDVLLPVLQSLTRLDIRAPSGADCQFNPYGQDRVADAGTKNFDHITDDRKKICDLENNVKDYCYKGRVQQEIDISRTMQLEEIFRCKPCALTGGVGTYYQTPLILDSEFSGGDVGPEAANLTNINYYRRSSHDKNYVRIMAFDNPEIHYSDRYFLEHIENTINNRFFATQKPSLEVQKDNMFIPGHRFLSMANLQNDLTHPNYIFRPWDYLFDILCPEDVPTGITIPDLNAQIVLGTNDDEFLTYDQFQLIYYGNGIAADIPQQGDHSTSQIPTNTVTHAIWSAASPGLSWFNADLGTRYAINQTEDGLQYPTRILEEQKDFICFTDELRPIFESADASCPCPEGDNVYTASGTIPIKGGSVLIAPVGGNNGVANFGVGNFGVDEDTPLNPGITGLTDRATSGVDFIDGNPAEFGCFTVDLGTFDFPRETITGYGFSEYGFAIYDDSGGVEQLDPAIALGLPLLSTTGKVQELCFKIGSGVRLEKNNFEYRHFVPYRLDCGCSKFECPVEITSITGTEASSIDLMDGFGEFNFGVGGFGGEILPVIVAGGGDYGEQLYGEGFFGGEPATPEVTGVEITEATSEPEFDPVVRCPLDFFQLKNGQYDWNCDRVILQPNMILNEEYGAKSCLMDGSIPNMMSFSDDKMVFKTILTAFEKVFPEEGMYQFIDDYGLIHLGLFETFDDRLDITTQIRDPRVPGASPTGEVKNFRTFRDGVITTDRQIVQVADFGFIILAEGGGQEPKRFQTTFGCGDEKFEDPFAFHLDANIVDDISLIVTEVGGS
jgi:P2-related tail formation protein